VKELDEYVGDGIKIADRKIAEIGLVRAGTAEDVAEGRVAAYQRGYQEGRKSVFLDLSAMIARGSSLSPSPVGAVNWDDPNNPAVKLFVGFDVEGYVEEYEFCADDGYYTPNDNEKSLLIDAIYGVVGDLHEKLRAIIPSSAAPAAPVGVGDGPIGYCSLYGLTQLASKAHHYCLSVSKAPENEFTFPIFGLPSTPTPQPEEGEVKDALIAKLTRALEPFANAVFNDNGDLTVDRSFATYDDVVRAYFVLKEARTALEGVAHD
jgi:hypothetical protein